MRMNLQEAERGEIFPGGDEKVPSDAKRFLDRLTKVNLDNRLISLFVKHPKVSILGVLSK